jgi:coenzyme F420-reducing hydrogenase gamma subunit
MVAHGTPCLGPVTHAGCGALCPSYHRGCYGCFGPMEQPNAPALGSWMAGHGLPEQDVVRVYRTFYAAAPAFRAESEARDG